MDDSRLTKPQLTALLDILTHAETASEVSHFKHPCAIANYGPPFSRPDDASSPAPPAVTSPLLQTLLVRLVLPAPGIRDLPAEFWAERVRGLLAGLARADLSESFDKGSVGTRRTLGTGASAVIEGVARGCLGGYPATGLLRGGGVVSGAGADGGSDGEVLEAGWDELVRGVVHGDLVDELCEWMEETDDVEGHSPVVKAAADYAIINLAGFLHHIFAVTSEAQYLLRLIQNAQKLIPYAVIRQILRVGNAATMLNSLLKLVLAKFGLATFSNWAGLTQNADEGMNLLQRKTCDRIEKAKNAPSSKHLSALKRHVQGTRERREELRESSARNSKSIVLTILDDADAGLSASLSTEQHDACLQYYAAMLSARDRDEIIEVLCRSNPDLLSQAVRDVVGAYEPMIRDLHDDVDLSEHLDNMRAFIDDLLAVGARNKKADGSGRANGERHAQHRAPMVEDYVELLRRHRGSVYYWLHQVSSKCPQVRDLVRDWVKGVARAFRPEESPGTVGGSALLDRVEALFVALPVEERGAVRSVLDRHAVYLNFLSALSTGRMGAVARTKESETAAGPGLYLAGWQSLLDNTRVTPDSRGRARTGLDVLDRTTPGKPGADGRVSLDGMVDAWEGAEVEHTARPDGGVVVEALGRGFHLLLREVAMRAAGMDGPEEGVGEEEGVEVGEAGKEGGREEKAMQEVEREG